MSDPPEVPIVVPELGNGDLAVRLGCWLVDVGDEITQGDRLAELVLPGTVFELTATASGRLTRIERANGAAVECGTVLGMFIPDRQESDDGP
jgi:pyruvate/2-oxoglutarate dehydrogenase complex dihydrolipoamide acyltransferase (E2) component